MDVDAEDDDGWTALHAAIYWGNMDVAEELVMHGADINKKTKLVRHILCSRNLLREKIFPILMVALLHTSSLLKILTLQSTKVFPTKYPALVKDFGFPLNGVLVNLTTFTYFYIAT